MIFGFLAVEEERNVQTFFRQCNSGRYSNGNTLVGRTVENGLFASNLFCIGLGIEFAQLCDLRTGFNFSSIDKVGNFATAFCGKITELQNTCILQEGDKFSFVLFHF